MWATACTRPAQLFGKNHVKLFVRGETSEIEAVGFGLGQHDWSNVVAACKRCNSTKDDKLLKEMPRGIEVKGKPVEKWALAFKPFQPRGTQWVVFGVMAEREPAWGPYLGVLPAPA